MSLFVGSIVRASILDAEYHLGLTAGAVDLTTAGDNSDKLNSAVAAMYANGSHDFGSGGSGPVLLPIQFAGKRFDFAEKIILPERTGIKISGMGVGRDTLAEMNYSSSTWGGPNTRWVWRGDAGGTMLEMPSYGSIIEGIFFQGAPAATQDVDTSATQAGIGVNIVYENTHLNTSKSAFRDCTFDRVNNCFVLGPAPPAAAHTVNHCDTVVLDNIHAHFNFPKDGGTSYNFYRVREGQSIYHWHRAIYINGEPTNGYYFEKGGDLLCDGISWGNGNLLRLGDLSINNSHFHIRGIKVDAVADDFKLLLMDEHDTGSCFVELSGEIGTYIYATPIITARGQCTVVLNGLKMIRPESLELIGGAADTWCNCRLDNCITTGGVGIEVDAMTDLLAPTSDPPYYFKWTNCNTHYHDAVDQYGRPFTDSHSISGGTLIS